MIITLSGPDGVGKSTQLQKMTYLFEERNIDYRVMYVRGGRTAVSRLYGGIISKCIGGKNRDLPKIIYGVGFSIAVIEMIYYWGIKLRIIHKKGRVILCDRYVWDTYVDFSQRYKLWSPNSFMWKFLLKSIVTPDIAILYRADADRIYERLEKKNEQVYPEEICAVNQRYETLYEKFDHIIDSSEDENKVFERARSIIESEIIK